MRTRKSDSFDVASMMRPRWTYWRYIGSATAARIAAIATTIISSISVNPRARRRLGDGSANAMVMAEILFDALHARDRHGAPQSTPTKGAPRGTDGGPFGAP